MTFFNFQGKDVYYEVHGQGKAIMILNGIMMSTASWQYFKDSLAANNMLILVDFLDQGKSQKLEEEYEQEIQVDLVAALLEELKLEKVNLVGISYGGEVALQFAIKYKEKLDRLVLFNTTGKTNPWLRDIGRSWNLSKDDPLNYYLTTIPIIYSPKFYNENTSWMDKRKDLLVESVFSNKEFMDAMERLTLSAESYNVLDRLGEIRADSLIVGAENDHITPLEEQKILNRGIKNSQLVILPETGHGLMYERPLLFVSLILGFVNVSQTDFKILE